MIRSDIINLAKKLIMQGDIDPLWSNEEWSMFFDEAVDIVHEALVDSETGFYEVRDYVIEPDENGKYQLPEDFYSMIFVRDSMGRLEHLSVDVERNYGTTGYIILGDVLEIRNADSRLTPIYIDYYKLPKSMPIYEGGSDEGNSVSNNPDDFVPDPPLNTLRTVSSRLASSSA